MKVEIIRVSEEELDISRSCETCFEVYPKMSDKFQTLPSQGCSFSGIAIINDGDDVECYKFFFSPKSSDGNIEYCGKKKHSSGNPLDSYYRGVLKGLIPIFAYKHFGLDKGE